MKEGFTILKWMEKLMFNIILISSQVQLLKLLAIFLMAASDTPIQDALWQLFAAVSSTGVELLDQANLLDPVSASVAGIVLLLGYFSLTEVS